MPAAGDLRNKIGFYKQSSTDDGYGNMVMAFGSTPEFTVAAQIAPKLGGEQVLAGRLTGTNLVNITVRQSTQTNLVAPDWRAKNERSGEIYNIRNIIDPDEKGAQHDRFWEMLCEKGAAA